MIQNLSCLNKVSIPPFFSCFLHGLHGRLFQIKQYQDEMLPCNKNSPVVVVAVDLVTVVIGMGAWPIGGGVTESGVPNPCILLLLFVFAFEKLLKLGELT